MPQILKAFGNVLEHSVDKYIMAIEIRIWNLKILIFAVNADTTTDYQQQAMRSVLNTTTNSNFNLYSTIHIETKHFYIRK